MVAAGYTLYSSATTMAISVGSGLHGFTLDYNIGEFVYSHHDIRIPERGKEQANLSTSVTTSIVTCVS